MESNTGIKFQNQSSTRWVVKDTNQPTGLKKEDALHTGMNKNITSRFGENYLYCSAPYARESSLQAQFTKPRLVYVLNVLGPVRIFCPLLLCTFCRAAKSRLMLCIASCLYRSLPHCLPASELFFLKPCFRVRNLEYKNTCLVHRDQSSNLATVK